MPVYKDEKRNTWYYSTWKKDIHGKNKKSVKRGFQTKKEAQLAEASFNLKSTENRSITFGELYLDYINYQKNNLKPRSFQCLQSRFNLHILPYFSKKKINNIIGKDVVDWHDELNKKGFAFRYRKVIHIHLSSILKYGVQHHGLNKNIASIIGGFKNDELKKDLMFWTYEEFQRFINVVDDLTYKTFFSLLYYTGLRLGETLSLNWKDIHDNVVKVNKTISQRTSAGGYVITTPKTKNSVRNVLMPSHLVKLLNDYYIYQKTFEGFNDKWFVFGGVRPLPETTIGRVKDNYCELAGVKRIKIHDFRHSHASLLINKGANPTIVAQRLGHSDIAMTLNTYSHMFPNSQNEIINLIDNM